MGNITNASHPLPQIWERINSRYLRHRLTQEIIEEHLVQLPSQEEQLALTANLKKRIALHHPSIAKVIYFRTAEDRSVCQQLQSNYEILIYTQYTGDTLESVAEEKGERLFHSPCQCTHILSAAEYLKDHFGYFLVTGNMIFLGNRREKSTKVWINSRVESSTRENPANEEEMCESLCSLLRYIKSNRICRTLTDDQIENAYRIRKLSHLKDIIFDAHRFREDTHRHKKSNSAAIFNEKNQENFKINSLERNDRNDKLQLNKKNHNGKANSMPQKNEQSKSHKGTQTLQLKPKDFNDQNKIYPKVNYVKSASPDIYYRPASAYRPLKVNFIYPQNEESSHPSENRIENKQAEVFPQLPRETSLQAHHVDANKSIENKNTSKERGEKKTLFSNIEALAVSEEDCNTNSVVHSPEMIKSYPDHDFTAREMELPLPEAEEKITPARLPTTSRSPKVQKEGEIKPIQEAPEIIHNRYQRKISTQSGKLWKNKEKPSSISNSGNKFEKYKDAIKSYEEKLRQKMANSVGSNNPVIIKPKNLLAVRKTTSSPKPSQYKQTKSVYNDSDDDLIGQPKITKHELPAGPAITFDKFDSEQSIPERDISYNPYKQPIKELQEKKKDQIISNKDITTKKIRERLEKMELEKQLQKQKIMIQNQMQDLLKQNAMRDEYRSIREKIKQKKETFAQLKAEATKILQDLEY